MKFVCDRCQTKYSIADDKVRGKVLKVRCKTCQNVITVREPGARPSVGALSPVRPSQPRPSSPLATLGEEEGEELGERTQLTTAPAALMAADLAKARRATPPPPPPLGDGIEWFLALEGVQQGPFTQKGLVDKLLAMPKDADVHVWNERMDGWKPPKDVPPIAKEIASRQAPALPMRPPVPRATPSPPVPPVAARRGTQPLTSGLGPKLPLPVATVGAAHAVPTPAAHPHLEDAAAALATPAPVAARGTNGLAHAGAAPALPAAGAAPAFPTTGDTDALSALNLRGPSAKKSGPLRIMDPVAATTWEGQQSAAGRGRGTKMVVAFLGVLGVIIVVVLMSVTKKPAPVVASTIPKNAIDTEAMQKLADNVAHEKLEPPHPPSTAPAHPPEPPTRGGHGHSAPTRNARGATHPSGGSTSPTTTAQTTAAAEDPTAAHMRESGSRNIAAAAAIAARPAPSQGDISRVINNNKIGIKTCYQRALLRDSNLTHGKIVVGLSIGISGRVKGVKVDGPTAFRILEPCIKEMVARWVFPQSYEEYGSEFSYVFQGSE